MTKISIDYDKLDLEGNNILDLCANYDAFTSNSKKILEELNSSWKSTNSNILQSKILEMINNIERDKLYLEKFGKLIIKVRREFQDDEENFNNQVNSDFDYLNDDLSKKEVI